MNERFWVSGISPDILYRKDLSDKQKMLVGIISGFMQSTGNFYASNKALGVALGIDHKTVSRMISDLGDKGILKVSVNRDRGNSRVIRLAGRMEVDERIEDTPPSDPSVTTLVISRSLPSDLQITTYNESKYNTISNSIVDNIEVEDIKSREETRGRDPISDLKYFIKESDNGSGRLALKKYPFVYLRPPELGQLIALFKSRGLAKEDTDLMFLKCNTEMEMKQRDHRAKGGLSYKYLTGHLLEEAVKLKKQGNYLIESESEKTKKAEFMNSLNKKLEEKKND